MKVIKTDLEGVVIIEPRIFEDSRGLFFESYNHDRYWNEVVQAEFIQDNVSVSKQNVLRGLHYQQYQPQGKLVSVLHGEVFDVAVDIRKGSPTFSKWVGVTLSAENHKQFYIPEGYAHGFCVLTESATFTYKCTSGYRPDDEHTLIYNDPAIGINWPCASPVLSDKDAVGMSLAELDAGGHLPAYQP